MVSPHSCFPSFSEDAIGVNCGGNSLHACEGTKCVPSLGPLGVACGTGSDEQLAGTLQSSNFHAVYFWLLKRNLGLYRPHVANCYNWAANDNLALCQSCQQISQKYDEKRQFKYQHAFKYFSGIFSENYVQFVSNFDTNAKL